jgi:hypothetical protein
VDRYSELYTYKKGILMDANRFFASTQVYLKPFYSLLGEILNSNFYSPSDIYNLDETNFRLPNYWKVNVVLPRFASNTPNTNNSILQFDDNEIFSSGEESETEHKFDEESEKNEFIGDFIQQNDNNFIENIIDNDNNEDEPILSGKREKNLYLDPQVEF